MGGSKYSTPQFQFGNPPVFSFLSKKKHGCVQRQNCREPFCGFPCHVGPTLKVPRHDFWVELDHLLVETATWPGHRRHNLAVPQNVPGFIPGGPSRMGTKGPNLSKPYEQRKLQSDHRLIPSHPVRVKNP